MELLKESLKILKKVFIGATIFYSSTTISAPIDFIDNTTFTTDTISKLDWLDVDITEGLSYDQVESELGNGGRLEGWRFATRGDFNQLLSNYLDTSITTRPFELEHNYYMVKPLIDLLGPTVSFKHSMLGEQSSIYAFLMKSQPSDSFTSMVEFRAFKNLQTQATSASSNTWHSNRFHSTSKSRTGDPIGSFLVRNNNLIATPVPAAAFMFAPALLGFLGLRRKMKS